LTTHNAIYNDSDPYFGEHSISWELRTKGT
jgi:hypothetical protein